jgi:LAO/AO transport system kinase
MKSVKALIKEVKAGNRRALARAITLVESTRADHRDQALLLMDELLEKNSHSIRIGLTGTPGVGKSTFIESFGMMLIKEGFKVAVLAVDPTSKLSGGSILGDKTRMELLSREPGAFIRPSPSQEYQGGVAPKTREAIALCEAANFDLIIVETVGVGQSEVMVSEMTDIFLLLMAPGGGDELQGVKRGIMEIADLVLVNKADGELKSTALRTCADYAGALRLLRKRHIDPDDFPKALTLSSLEATGLEIVWREINLLKDYRTKTGVWIDQRRNQSLDWFESELKRRMIQKFEKDSKFLKLKNVFKKEVWDEKITPERAAEDILKTVEKNK